MSTGVARTVSWFPRVSTASDMAFSVVLWVVRMRLAESVSGLVDCSTVETRLVRRPARGLAQPWVVWTAAHLATVSTVAEAK